MKFGKLLIILFIQLSTFSCSISIKEINYEVKIDYGNINENKITYLLDDVEPFFESENYGFIFVVGMKIKIIYKGKISKKNENSNKIDDSKIEIISIEYTYPNVYHYKYGQTPGAGDECSIYPVDENHRFYTDYYELLFENVILENGEYKQVLYLPPNKNIFLITNYDNGHEILKGIYTYSPF